jgi:hypothetical protein
MLRHFAMLEESNYVKSGAPTPQYECKRSPAAQEKSEDAPIRTAYNTAQPGAADMLPIAAPKWPGKAARQFALNFELALTRSSSHSVVVSVSWLSVGAHCTLRALPSGHLRPTTATSSRSAHAFPGHFWLGQRCKTFWLLVVASRSFQSGGKLFESIFKRG